MAKNYLILISIILGEAKVMKYLVRANYLLESWRRSRNISRLNGQKSFKNVVWIYWVKSRCLNICTDTLLQYIVAFAAHYLF